MSVRTRKRALWMAACVAWLIAAGVLALSIANPEQFHWRTLTILALTVASTLFGTASIASLITGPDVAYRLGVNHGRAGTCDQCRPDIRTGTDAVILRFPAQHTETTEP